MEHHLQKTIGCLLLLTLTTCSSVARDAARDLKKMKGYTIVDAAAVSEVLSSKLGDRIVKLDNGTAYSVRFLLLDPLPFTDVIVFAKPPSKQIKEKFGDKLPDTALYTLKLLIDNEAFDATPVKAE
jgi:hypothetical protein